MCISVNAFIKYCVYGDTDYSKALPLMAKCAVLSNGVVSYNLPLNDAALENIDSKEAGNKFTDIVKIITNGKMKDTENNEIELPDDFKTNSDNLLKKIIEEAKNLKEKAEKNYNEKLKSLKLGDEE